MSIAVAEAVVAALSVYALVGAVHGLVFLLFGLARVDRSAAGSGLGFRLLIFPGLVAFWPLMALRWASGGPPPIERNAHRAAAGRRR